MLYDIMWPNGMEILLKRTLLSSFQYHLVILMKACININSSTNTYYKHLVLVHLESVQFYSLQQNLLSLSVLKWIFR